SDGGCLGGWYQGTREGLRRVRGDRVTRAQRAPGGERGDPAADPVGRRGPRLPPERLGPGAGARSFGRGGPVVGQRVRDRRAAASVPALGAGGDQTGAGRGRPAPDPA